MSSSRRKLPLVPAAEAGPAAAAGSGSLARAADDAHLGSDAHDHSVTPSDSEPDDRAPSAKQQRLNEAYAGVTLASPAGGECHSPAMPATAAEATDGDAPG